METKQYTWRTYQEIEICQDCLHVSASGAPDYEGYTESGHAERYAQAVKQYGDEPYCTQEEPTFSWQACDYCNDTLGGNRFTASVMQLHTEGQ